MVARLQALRSFVFMGGSIVHSKKFVANLHRWRSTYASAIPDDVRVKLLKSRMDNEPLVDANDLDARIITFRPFYFPWASNSSCQSFSRCAPSQCTPNVYWAIMCIENLSRFFMLELTVREFFYFFEVRHFERYAQVRVYKAKLFNSLSQGDHAWHDVLEVSGRWRATSVTAHLSPSPIAMQLELGPDMAKVRRALNIPLRFRVWRWLLSEYREEDGGLPPAEDVERWKQNDPDPDDQLSGQEECSAEFLSKRKAAAKSSRGEATSSHARDGLHRGKNQGSFC
ncbi:Protein kinase family protein with leucine-rich repeat domain, partial [Prunus dulcis]